MKNISLKRKYISVINESGKVIGTGGNQGWIVSSPKKNIRGQGCGMISAIDLCLYLMGTTTIGVNDYAKLTEGFLNINRFAKLCMREFFGGRVAVGITPKQMCRYINKLLSGKYKARWNGIHGHRNLLQEMSAMIDKDIPVIWALYSPKKKLSLYSLDSATNNYKRIAEVNSHYVNAISIIEDSNRTMIKISSWGKIYYVDYNEYLSFARDSILSKVCSNIVLIKRL